MVARAGRTARGGTARSGEQASEHAHLRSGGTLHRNPAVVSSHLEEESRVRMEHQAGKRGAVGRMKRGEIPLKSPGTSL